MARTVTGRGKEVLFWITYIALDFATKCCKFQQHSAIEKALLKEKNVHLQDITKLQADIAKLEAEQSEMQQIRDQVHEQLGRAIYDEIASQVQALKKKVEQTEQAHMDAGTDLFECQTAIKSRLQDWPELARLCRKEHGRPPEEKVTPTVFILKAYIKFLKTLVDAHKLSTTKNVHPARLVHLLTINEQDVRAMLNPSGSQARAELYSSRVADVKNWLEEHQGEVRAGVAAQMSWW